MVMILKTEQEKKTQQNRRELMNIKGNKQINSCKYADRFIKTESNYHHCEMRKNIKASVPIAL